MVSTLREELASLKIERSDPGYSSRRLPTSPSPSRRGGGILRLFAWLLWLIPLGLLAVGGSFAYKQYDQIRSRPISEIGEKFDPSRSAALRFFSSEAGIPRRTRGSVRTGDVRHHP